MKLLHEGIGHTVTCELKTGEMYRGHLMNCEDNMNAMLEGVTVTGRDGKVTNLEQVYLRRDLGEMGLEKWAITCCVYSCKQP